MNRLETTSSRYIMKHFDKWWKEYPRCRDRLPLKPEDHTDPLWFFLDDRAQQNDYFE